ncbi:MAG: DUF2071 domain-containing protein [Aridibacter sp.]
MNIPTIQGIIKRRVLINYRAEPSVIHTIIPNNFTPKLQKEFAIAGICLIHLEHIRPKHLPEFIGISSENAAHRITVEWNENGKTKQGVFIPRRDTDSLLNQLAGGRIFPSEHHKATFNIVENENKIDYTMRSNDGEVSLKFNGNSTDNFPSESIFDSLKEASEFFEKGSHGYSPNKMDKNLDGVKLQIDNWQVKPLEITSVESSFYNDESIFPKGTIEFDHALIMQNIEHEWHSAENFKLCQ